MSVAFPFATLTDATLTDVEIAPYTTEDAHGPFVALPLDAHVAVDPDDPAAAATVNLAPGDVPADVMALFLGGRLAERGPHRLLITDVLRPFFVLTGRYMGRRGRPCRMTLHRVRFSLPAGTFSDDTFHLARCDGRALGDQAGIVSTVSIPNE